jgi:hypothetical protein
MKYVTSWALLSLSLLLAGCSTFSAEKLHQTKENIELAIGQLGAGDYKLTGTLEKDGMVWGTVTTTWTCRQGADGKLGGCTEPKVAIKPMK